MGYTSDFLRAHLPPLYTRLLEDDKICLRKGHIEDIYTPDILHCLQVRNYQDNYPGSESISPFSRLIKSPPSLAVWRVYFFAVCNPALPTMNNYTRRLYMRFIITMALLVLLFVGCTPKTYTFGGRDLSTDTGANLHIPGSISLKKINGREVRGLTDSLISQEAFLILKPGHYRFVASYEDIWSVGEEDFEKFTSRPIAIHAQVEAGTEYTLALDNEPLTVKQAKKFAKNPQIIVLEKASGRNITTPPQKEAEYKARIQEPIDSIQSLTAKTISPAKEDEPTTGSPLTPLAALKHWWNEASANEKKDFQQWIWQ